MQGLVGALDGDPKTNFTFGLQLFYEFERKFPPDKEVTKGNETKTLNYTLLEDCITARQLRELKKIDCANPENKGKSVIIRFAQAFNPNLLLGAT